MNFKLLIFNVLLIFCLSTNSIFAQRPEKMSIGNRYDNFVEKRKNNWQKLLPTQSILQYAGNMGFMSLGVGWDYGKSNQWETNFLVGFLPKFDSEKVKGTLTLKENFLPWQLLIKEKTTITPFVCGLYINTIFGNEFWRKQPDKYPKGYYWFSTKSRFNLFIGQRITRNFLHDNFFNLRGCSAFYEVSTSEIMIIYKVKNNYIKFSDMICLSVGLNFQIL